MFKPRSQPQQNYSKNLPAPFGGFDPSSVLTAMKAINAPVMENYLAQPDGIVSRDGYLTHITGIANRCLRLHTYSSPSGGESLWGTTSDGIFNFTVAGVCPAAAIALTNGATYSTSITTGAGSFLLVCNGTDTIKQYDGAAWTSIPLFGATATSVYSYIAVYRQRIFLIKKNSLEIEYLASNSIGGAATNYPLGALFRRGGSLIAMAVWTLDGGVGPEDNLVIVSSKGEIAIFVGNDPAVWALRGVYSGGNPIGDNPIVQYGGDVLLLTESGLTALSSLVQSMSIDRIKTVSEQIRPYLVAATTANPSGQGWQIFVDPIKPYLAVNIPGVVQPYQAVMQSQTMGWSTFSGWNALCFGRLRTEMYFSGSDGVAGAWKIKRITGSSDDNTNITATMLQAYNQFGVGNNKKIELIRPYFKATGAFQYTLGVSSNFQDVVEYTSINLSNGLSASTWGTGLWGTAVWSGSALVSDDYQNVPDQYANWKALYLQTVSRVAAVKYLGSDILYKKGGHF